PFFRSPVDSILTALTCALMAGCLGRALGSSPRPFLRRLPVAVLGFLALAAGGHFLWRLASEIPGDARVAITRVDLSEPQGAKVLVQSALCLLVGTWVYLGILWIKSSGWKLVRPERAWDFRLITPTRGLALVSCSVLAFLPLLIKESNRQREAFFQETLLPEVEGQE